jgi:hypothetical protein
MAIKTQLQQTKKGSPKIPLLTQIERAAQSFLNSDYQDQAQLGKDQAQVSGNQQAPTPTPTQSPASKSWVASLMKQGNLTQDANGVLHGVLGGNVSQQGRVLAAQTSPIPSKGSNDYYSPRTHYSLPQLTSMIQQGMQKYNPNAPVATEAAQLAQVGQNLPDQFAPAVLSLKESSGGTHLSAPNNLFNLGPGIAYPNTQTSIIGGNGKLGLQGVLQSPTYDDYMQSGDLRDLFQHFTPATPGSGNAGYDQQIDTYHQLRSNFVPQSGQQ